MSIDKSTPFFKHFRFLLIMFMLTFLIIGIMNLLDYFFHSYSGLFFWLIIMIYIICVLVYTQKHKSK
jgi:hypothetical protein